MSLHPCLGLSILSTVRAIYCSCPCLLPPAPPRSWGRYTLASAENGCQHVSERGKGEGEKDRKREKAHRHTHLRLLRVFEREGETGVQGWEDGVGESPQVSVEM